MNLKSRKYLALVVIMFFILSSIVVLSNNFKAIDNIVTIKFTTLCGNIKTYSRVSPYLKNKLTLQQSDIKVSTRVSPALRAKVKI